MRTLVVTPEMDCRILGEQIGTAINTEGTVRVSIADSVTANCAVKACAIASTYTRKPLTVCQATNGGRLLLCSCPNSPFSRPNVLDRRVAAKSLASVVASEMKEHLLRSPFTSRVRLHCIGIAAVEKALQSCDKLNSDASLRNQTAVLNPQFGRGNVKGKEVTKIVIEVVLV